MERGSVERKISPRIVFFFLSEAIKHVRSLWPMQNVCVCVFHPRIHGNQQTISTVEITKLIYSLWTTADWMHFSSSRTSFSYSLAQSVFYLPAWDDPIPALLRWRKYSSSSSKRRKNVWIFCRDADGDSKQFCRALYSVAAAKTPRWDDVEYIFSKYGWQLLLLQVSWQQCCHLKKFESA